MFYKRIISVKYQA